MSMSKIIINFKGGLGNQVYQLAAGIMIQKELKLKISYNDVQYQYESNKRQLTIPYIFKIPMSFNYKSKFKFFLEEKLSNYTFNFYNKLSNNYIFTDKDALLKLSKKSTLKNKNIILSDYFQFDYVIRKSEITSIKSKLTPEVKNNNIGIHIRLGDYLNSQSKDIYNHINPHFILKAYNILLKNGANPKSKIIIYSDSPKLAEQMAKNALPHKNIFLSQNNTDVEDFRGLASHKYSILSNSSFSLLSWYFGKPDFSVIPSNWFKNLQTNKNLLPREKNLITMRL